LLAFILGAAAVFIILGKAAILSLSIALVYFIRKLKGKRLGLLLFFFCFALITYAIFSQYASGLVSRIGSTFIDKNTEARLEEYRVAFRIVQERPLLGVGSGQQLAYYQRYINPDYRKLINNYVTQAAVDYGLVGLAIFAVLLWSIFGQSRHLTKRLSGDSKVIGRALNASLIVAAINGLFEVTVFTLFYAIFLWLLIGLASIIKYGKIDGYHN
jgi:O-antigen ligase